MRSQGPPPVSRRSLMVGGLSAGGAAIVANADSVAEAATGDPRLSAVGQIKIGASLDERPAYWVYSGVIYAVRPNERPLAVLAVSGCASYWAVRTTNNDFDVRGATVSYFRDPVSGDFIHSFENPFTHTRNEVEANVLTGGGLIYPADGSSAYAMGQFSAGTVAPGGFRASEPQHPLGGLRWAFGAKSVMLTTDRAWNVAVQPQLEAQTQSADKVAFFDPNVIHLPARFSATTIAPWMRWMEMRDAPGHMVWHTAGEKSFSADDIPTDYRHRAGADLDLLTTRPAS